MREQILANLNQAVSFHKEIKTLHTDSLPEAIINGCDLAIESGIPTAINNLIGHINSVERKELYPQVKSIQEGIEFFSNPDLDKSIDKAINDTTMVGFDGSTTPIPSKRIIEGIAFAINTSVDSLRNPLMLARLTQSQG